MSVLVDSNVILDVVTEDAKWFDWSSEALENAAQRSPLIINPIIFAEVSLRFTRIEELEEVLPSNRFIRVQLPYASAFLAGKVFLRYRRRGGPRTAPLPDFFIGAHAAVANLQLLTRDPGRYRTYFPDLGLITP
ncbi:MAG TPA: type II toxin-antitoxin system VapC family toxin [Xanthobacteraceae bacterium]|nr:type II toxin-antitoxin system VapC family toxin [Xanthobacteraceae bacterium]